MRWKGVIFLMILIVIIIGLSFLLTDKFFEKQIETLGSRAIGAKVELDGFSFALFTLHTHWDSLQVTDPNDTWQNILATGPSDFKVQLGPLLSKKIIVDKVVIQNAVSGEKRSTDGKIILPPKKKKVKKPSKPNIFTKTTQKLKTEMEQAPAFNLDQFTRKVNVDSIIALLDIKSPDKIDSTHKALNEQYAYWDQLLKEQRIQKDLKDIEEKAKTIKLDEIKDLASLQKALSTIGQIRVKVDSVQAFSKRTKNGLQTDLESGQKAMRLMDDWIKADYASAMSKAHLPDINAQNIGKLIFGKQIVEKFNRVLNITETVRTYSAKLQGSKPKKEKPPRFKGQDIPFGQKKELPKYWIKHVDLSGNAWHVDLTGTLDHLVSNQKQIGKPTTLKLDGTKADGAGLDIGALFNYVDSLPKENYNVTLKGMPLAGVELSDSPLMPYEVKQGKGALTAALNFEKDAFTGSIGFIASEIKFDYGNKKPKNDAERIIRSVLDGTSTVSFDAKLKGKGDNLKFTVDSNLDKLISSKLKSILSGEVESAKKKLIAEVDRRIDPYKRKMEALVSEKQDELQKQMDSLQKQADEKLKYAQDKKKEIEKRIEDEKKKQQNKVEDAIKDKLEDIF